MRFWVFDPKRRDALGPYDAEQLAALPNFGPETVVAPDGAKKSAEWKPAKAVDALRPMFSKPPPFPSVRPELPAAQVAEPEYTGAWTLGATVATIINLPWEAWLCYVTNGKDAHVEETFWVYAVMMLAPTLTALGISFAARRRAVRENRRGPGAATTALLTINWLVIIILSLWLSLLYASHRISGS